jgi:hypothetical protein
MEVSGQREAPSTLEKEKRDFSLRKKKRRTQGPPLRLSGVGGKPD